MKCEYCPLSDPEDVCPESENEYGTEDDLGRLGCRHPWNWVKKRENIYDEYIYEMGLDMGTEMSMSDEELTRAISMCKHMVGLDYMNPYHRHDKAYYRAYRNYFSDVPAGNPILDKLPEDLLQVVRSDKATYYRLTKSGIQWLGRQLKIKISEIK